ncbi:MAG: hypothetical protein ACE5D7_09835 [Fidelibacterota bacterium]
MSATKEYIISVSEEMGFEGEINNEAVVEAENRLKLVQNFLDIQELCDILNTVEEGHTLKGKENEND